jgi:hypothetical protein
VKQPSFWIALCIGCGLTAAPPLAAAVPAARPAEQTATASLPFEPPLDRPLRYRYQKVVDKNGKKDMSWSLDDYRFAKAADGYLVTVTPVSYGFDDSDPLKAAFYKKLADLISRPYVLKVDAEARITELVDAEAYLKEIQAAADAALVESPPGGKPLEPEVRKFISDFMQSFFTMTPEARLAVFTQSAQPFFEFAATEWSSAEPLEAELEAASPFGDVKRKVRVSLTQVGPDAASLSVHSTVSPAEIERILKAVIRKFASGLPTKPTEQQLQDAVRGLRMEGHGSYDVSLSDGLVVKYRSTETVQGGPSDDRNVTTVSLERVGS